MVPEFRGRKPCVRESSLLGGGREGARPLQRPNTKDEKQQKEKTKKIIWYFFLIKNKIKLWILISSIHGFFLWLLFHLIKSSKLTGKNFRTANSPVFGLGPEPRADPVPRLRFPVPCTASNARLRRELQTPILVKAEWTSRPGPGGRARQIAKGERESLAANPDDKYRAMNLE